MKLGVKSQKPAPVEGMGSHLSKYMQAKKESEAAEKMSRSFHVS